MTATTILYVNNTDLQDGGGGDRRLREEATRIANRGYDVLAITGRTDPSLRQSRDLQDVNIRTIKCVPDLLYRWRTIHFYLSRALFPLLSLPVLAWTLFHRDVDLIVDSHTPHPSLVLVLSPMFSVPVVALVHEYHDKSALQKYPLPVGLIQLTVQNFLRAGLYSAIIVPHKLTRKQLEAYGVDDPIFVIPNGIDYEYYATPPDSINVEPFEFLTVSRLVHRKGIDRALHAMEKVVNERPSVRLGIIGSGPDREKLERLADRLGIESNVTFLGYVSEARKVSYLHEAGIFVLPSRQEGFGIAPLEAMAVGKPVIANDLEILRDLLLSGPNRLVDASDPEILASAMVEVLDSRANDRDTRIRNQRAAQPYSLDRVSERAQSVYQSLIA